MIDISMANPALAKEKKEVGVEIVVVVVKHIHRPATFCQDVNLETKPR